MTDDECRNCLPGGLKVSAVVKRNPDGLYYDEIAAIMHLTREEVIEAEQSALKKLKNYEFN